MMNGIPIRVTFAALVLATALPFVALLGYNVYSRALQEAESAAAETLRAARVSARKVEATLDRARLVLSVLARSAPVRSLDPAQCAAIVAAFSELSAEYTNLVTVRSNGDRVCSATPPPRGAPASVNPRFFLDQTIRTRGFTVGELVRGVLSGRWVLAIAYPILDDAGELSGAVSGPLDVARLRFIADSSELPLQSVALIVDAKGTIVASSAMPEESIGRSVAEAAWFKLLGPGRESSGTARDGNGIEHIYGSVPVAGTDWHAVVGLPLDLVRQPIAARLRVNGLVSLLALVLALALAYLIARGTVKPVERIAALVRQAGKPALQREPARMDLDSAPREVRVLADTFGAMLEARRKAELQLQDSEAGLRRAQAMAQLSHVITRDDGAFESWSDTLPELIGRSAAEVPATTREWVGLLHPEDREAFRAASIEAARLGARGYVDYRLGRPDGAWIHVRQVMEPMPAREPGGPARWFTTLQNITVQRRAADAMRKADLNYRSVFENAVEGIFRVDSQGRVAAANPSLARMLGYASFEEMQAGIANVQHEVYVDAQARPRFLEQLRTQGTVAGFETQWRRRDGKVIWVSLSGRDVRDAASGLAYHLGTVTEITQQKLAQEELRRSEGLKGAILESSLDCLITIDSDGNVLEFNPAAEATFGFRLADVRGKPIADLIIPQRFREAHRRGLARYLATGEATVLGKRLELFALRADGAEIPVELAISAIRTAPTPMFTAALRDITERKRSEAELQRFRLALDHSADIVLVIDCTTMRHVDANAAACRLLGYSREELLQMGPQDLLPVSRAELEKAYAQLIADPSAASGMESYYRCRDGSHLPFESTRQVFRSGDRWLLAVISRDIRERIAAEKALRESEAGLQRLNRVYAVLSGVNALIVRVRERHELFRECCRLAVHAGGFTYSWVGVVDKAERRLRVVASQGADADYVAAMPLGLDAADKRYGLAGQALSQGSPLVVADLATDSRVLLKDDARQRGFHSLVMLPLTVAGEQAGVLAMYASEIGFFDEDELKLLRELAGNIAFALEHMAKTDRLEYLAYHDPLTGLANRAFLMDRLEQASAAAASERREFALVLNDIERFKIINDTLGRHAGDELLKQVAARLGDLAGKPDRVARISADQFAVLIPDVADEARIARILDEGVARMEREPFMVGGTALRIAVRSGAALFPRDATQADALFQNAEAALKSAKAGGEKYLFYAQQMSERVAGRLGLENKLRLAIDNEEFVLHYQPKVALDSRRIVGLEALIRWQSPELGLVPPVRFIPLLEETGLILPVGAWALKRAARDHRAWFEQGLKPPRVAVNVSAIQLRQRDFVAVVENAIIDGLAPVGIDLEITESLVMEDIQRNIEKLNAVRALGLKIAIDDFGTGYSSLAYLARLPVETLKIDRSFIQPLLDDANSTLLVQTMISLAHSLRLQVVAEGVESEEQANALRLMRCDQMQGYVVSKPLSESGIAALLRAEAAA